MKGQWHHGRGPATTSFHIVFQTNTKACYLTYSRTFPQTLEACFKKMTCHLTLTHPRSSSSSLPSPPFIEEDTTAHTFPSLNCHRIFSFILRCLMSVPAPSRLAGQKQDTFPIVSVCACRLSKGPALFLCVAWRQKKKKKKWQRAMVLTQKWVLQLLCVCVRACVACASPRYDGDSWGATGRCSALFRPDALVTLWSCSLLLTPLSTQREALQGGGGWIWRASHSPLGALATVQSRALGNVKIQKSTLDAFEYPTWPKKCRELHTFARNVGHFENTCASVYANSVLVFAKICAADVRQYTQVHTMQMCDSERGSSFQRSPFQSQIVA